MQPNPAGPCIFFLSQILLASIQAATRRCILSTPWLCSIITTSLRQAGPLNTTMNSHAVHAPGPVWGHVGGQDGQAPALMGLTVSGDTPSPELTHGSHPCLGAAQGPLCWTFPIPPHCRLGPLHSCPVQTAGSLVAFPEAQAPCSPSHGSAKAPIKEPCIISIPLKSLQGS